MNISSWIEKWATATPEKVAIRFEEQDITYPEFNDRIKSAARMLKHELGVTPGDCVAYLGQNLILVFACARLGAIFVPLNWRLAPAEHLHMLKDSSAVLLFVDEPFTEQCKQLDAEAPACQFVAVNAATTAG